MSSRWPRRPLARGATGASMAETGVIATQGALRTRGSVLTSFARQRELSLAAIMVV